MIRRQDITTQADGVTPRAGVFVTVKIGASLAPIYDADDGNLIAGSLLLSGVDGSFEYWVAIPGTYTEEFRLSLLDQPRAVQAVEIGADSSFSAAGTGAIVRSYQEKLRETISAADFGVVSDGITNATTAVQALLAAHPGKIINFDGNTAITGGVIDVSGDNTHLRFRNNAGFTYTGATTKAITVSGNNVTLEGLNLTGPATFDGTNTQPTYGMIWVTGDNCKIVGGKLTNVPKAGIMFSECEGGFVSGVTIEGNYPTASFTGTQTGHAGVWIDARSTGRQGAFKIEACDISECVQGVLIANYGPTSRSQGILVSGNTFTSIWNHGVYGAGTNYSISVTGNSFIYCQGPVAMTGYYHLVSDNTITTGGSSGTYTDQVGISLRDPVHCIVANNTIQGETGIDQIVLNLQVQLGTVVRGNVVSGNTMMISGSGSANMIALGGNTCTDLTDNLVSGNVCIGPGRAAQGMIQIVGVTNCPAHGTIVSQNTIVTRSASYGVSMVNLVGAAAFQNKIRLEYDAPSAVNLGAIFLSGCSNCDAEGNPITVTAAWGTNVTYRGIWEDGTSSGNRASNNAFRADPTKLAAALHYFTVSGSGIIVDDKGIGAPGFNCGVGSTWKRTDGGAATTLYVKESGTSAAGFVGK